MESEIDANGEVLRGVQLLGAMKATAGSRFNAAQYLENNDRDLTWVTAITSVYIIAITVLPSFWKLPADVTENLNLVTIVFSIVILVSALLHNSRRDAVNAEQHHRSALEISELRRELITHGGNLERDVLMGFSSRYGAILQKYSINHSPLDYHKFMADRPDQFPWMSWIARFRIKTLFLIRNILSRTYCHSGAITFVWFVLYQRS